jgi:hypothetical protein
VLLACLPACCLPLLACLPACLLPARLPACLSSSSSSSCLSSSSSSSSCRRRRRRRRRRPRALRLPVCVFVLRWLAPIFRLLLEVPLDVGCAGVFLEGMLLDRALEWLDVAFRCVTQVRLTLWRPPLGPGLLHCGCCICGCFVGAGPENPCGVMSHWTGGCSYSWRGSPLVICWCWNGGVTNFVMQGRFVHTARVGLRFNTCPG